MIPYALLLFFACSQALTPATAASDPSVPPANKLLYMYQFFYLPFSLDFQEGRNTAEVLPYRKTKNGNQLVSPKEFNGLLTQWSKIRQPWVKKSLLLNTPISDNETIRITPRLVSHKIKLTRGVFDQLSITEKLQVNEALRDKNESVVAAFRQLRFLKSFLEKQDEDKFNLFIFSPSWCESSREYRMLLEAYAKEFPNPRFTLHSVVIEDPKEEIFDSRLLKELFPNPGKYSIENVPRFLAFEVLEGAPFVWEEGEALREAYERFFKDHRGYLDAQTTLFGKTPAALRSLSTKPSRRPRP